ncbi:hypothetical protein [Rhodococcus sp. 077-4]|uniref:hypothetical protein n=1 Tax=Rhodococcus sp. 077-4 TaxID=2789271 RepID=UPI0039F57CCF
MIAAMQTGLDIAVLRAAVLMVPLISVAALWITVVDKRIRGYAVPRCWHCCGVR